MRERKTRRKKEEPRSAGENKGRGKSEQRGLGDDGGRRDVTDRLLGNRHHVPHGQRQPGKPQRSARPRSKAGGAARKARTRNEKRRRVANTTHELAADSENAFRWIRFGRVGSLPIIDATPMPASCCKCAIKCSLMQQRRRSDSWPSSSTGAPKRYTRKQLRRTQRV